MSTALASDEIALAVELEPWSSGHGFAFEEFSRRRGDFAVIGCGAMVQLDPATQRIQRLAIGLCGAGALPLRLGRFEQASMGRLANAGLLEELVTDLSDLDFTDDATAPAAYRRRLAITLGSRALTTAIARARRTEVTHA
jgi:aerobic carbon-monoxide dehydrogenase medium subunit